MRQTILLFAAIAGCLITVQGFTADPPSGFDALEGKKSTGSVPEWKELARWSELPQWVTSVAFSADDKTLAIGLKDEIRLVDVTTQSVKTTVPVKSGQIRSISFSSDGKRWATGSYQNVTLFDAATNERIRNFAGHRGYVTCVAFSPDGQRLATACEDELARVWDLGGNAPVMTLKGHDYPVTGITWSTDGKLIATSAGDETRPTKPGRVRIWDAASGAMQQQFELHKKAATGVAFSPNGHYLLSSSVDERVNVYDLNVGKPLGFFAGHSRPTNAVAVFPDSRTAISISGGRAVGKNELIAWELETGEIVASVEAHEAKITSLALSHNRLLVATGSQDKTVALWDASVLAMTTNATGTDAEPADAHLVLQAAAAAEPAAEKQPVAEAPPKVLRAGIIGLDTSHAIAFTKTLNANPPVPAAEGVRVVAAYPKGSPDIKASVSRVPGYTEDMKKLNVEIVDSIDELLKRVDVVLLESNDGRPHLEQFLPCLKAGKPTFIDKPIAGSLVDAIAILELAKQHHVPVFSSSSLRFGKNTQAVRGGLIGKVSRCETSSPASLEPTHPDLFWYAIHGVESLFTVMGTGCISVVRSQTADGKIQVVGQWNDNRVGTFREIAGYQGLAVGDKGESPVGAYDGYDPLVYEIVKFFKTGQPPVTAEETLEIYAFMEAADESKRQNGASVTLESVMTKARAEAMKKIAELK